MSSALCLAATLAALTAGAAAPAPRPAEVQAAIQRAQHNALELMVEGNRWNFPSYIGTHYVSQYSLMLRWLGRTETRLDLAVLRQRLFEEQLPDGSWYAIPDRNLRSGELSASVWNYWALKAMGESLDSPRMSRAREFILSRGGLEKVNAFTRIFLAMFGNGRWDFLPEIPYLLFNVNLPFSLDSFAQWVGPHLMPIAYLRAMEPSRELGPQFQLDELIFDPKARERLAEYRREHRRRVPDAGELDLIRFTLGRQQPMGSIGAYAVSTILSIAAFDDFARFRPAMAPRLRAAMDKGFSFIEQGHFGSGDGNYHGVVDDGHYWDTALVGIGLQDSGVPLAKLKPAVDYLVRNQSSNGGFAFGNDFWYAPDTDDTAEILLFLRPHASDPKVERAGRLALRWLEQMQNSDHGWGAFSKDNEGNWLLKSAASGLADSADLFDESSPDVVGHILEAFGAWGQTRLNSKTVRRAIDYLKQTQQPNGTWWARWGINYVYGTEAAVVGLVRVGEDPNQPYLRRALDWIERHQNPDGGFGETSASYDHPELAGFGMSTPSQTAWALIALVEGGRGRSPVAARAAAWLESSIRAEGRWVDHSCVGTGHPGIIYMVYPSYPYAWPLSALARWARANELVTAQR